MANRKSFDTILGVSKKMIHPSPTNDHDNQSEAAKRELSSTIEKMKTKSEELSSKVLQASIGNDSCEKTDIYGPCLDFQTDSKTGSIEVEDIVGELKKDSTQDFIEDSIEDSVEDSVEKQARGEIHNGLEPDQEIMNDENPSMDHRVRYSEYVDHLQEEIKFLKQQLEVKDHQLDKKDELILNFQVLLKSEQDKVLRLESSLEVENKSKEENDSERPNNWLIRLFGKKTR